ncbi:hypothetical protein IKE67_03405 [bacterium]|nr:hypothetical protein [bacterium]
MNNNTENQFKKFLIIIVIIVSAIIYGIIKPDFFKDKNSVLKLSSQKPWQEEFLQDKADIDDVDIKIEYPENEFKKDDAENKFDFDFAKPSEDEYLITGSIPINPMTDLNYKTKEEIYKLRKSYVEKTIFKNRRYTPSEDVFGQIADKKPWLGIEALTCYGKNPKAHMGLSEESRYINNPTMLIGLDRVSFDEKPKNLCSVVDYLMPVKINYSKDENTIKVVFEVSEYRGDLGKNFLLKGLNAKDFGYLYAYADKLENVAFLQPDVNISNNVHQFQDFIHLGQACGVSGGCNNGSPFQKELNFTVMKYPASIHFRLWKKQPKNPETKEDINYLIILK